MTLGAESFPPDADGKPMKGIARHPIIEDDVIVYAGATILGRVTIGRGWVIGGNVWLTRAHRAASAEAGVVPRWWGDLAEGDPTRSRKVGYRQRGSTFFPVE